MPWPARLSFSSWRDGFPASKGGGEGRFAAAGQLDRRKIALERDSGSAGDLIYRSTGATDFPTIVRPVTAKQRRWQAMREQMGLKP
jgi:hypothetical protein